MPAISPNRLEMILKMHSLSDCSVPLHATCATEDCSDIVLKGRSCLVEIGKPATKSNQ